MTKTRSGTHHLVRITHLSKCQKPKFSLSSSHKGSSILVGCFLRVCFLSLETTHFKRSATWSITCIFTSVPALILCRSLLFPFLTEPGARRSGSDTLPPHICILPIGCECHTPPGATLPAGFEVITPIEEDLSAGENFSHITAGSSSARLTPKVCLCAFFFLLLPEREKNL